MRFLRLLALLPALLLQGCFFFYIPGSFIDSAADGISGKVGQHCVSRYARVGDSIRLPDGSQWRVEKLEGEWSRCQQAEIPIRAKLVPIT